ncbi:GTPase Era, mitochondrial isoform X1 [Frankliniella occidentalis]|uniref:GTPase Era, mitochondrial n=2 Tax=Frankliniella occidentalis TaxID=133901 RepID=A0A6J1T5U7_FRAOC|nr:GTPase Era, mitochondrial isoform X1 [Frankliniella occidentalis]
MWWSRHTLLSCLNRGSLQSRVDVVASKLLFFSGPIPKEGYRSITNEVPSLHDTPRPVFGKKIVKVALVGRPNVGKSTLINQVVGRTTCPVSMKAHTTRAKVKAFVNEGDTQIVFFDTPGLVSPQEISKYKFESEFLRSAEEAIQEADVIGVVHDASFTKIPELDPLTLRLLLLYQRKGSFLVLNKVDALKRKHNLLNLVTALTRKPKSHIVGSDKLTEQQVVGYLKNTTSWPHFSEVFMISALNGDGVGDIKEFLLNEAQPGRWLVKQNKVTNPDKLAIDFVKAACLDFLQDEIPYTLTFKLNYFEDYEDKCAIEVSVMTKNKRHYRMTMDKVRPIAAYAESHLASALEKECRLRIQITTKDTDE